MEFVEPARRPDMSAADVAKLSRALKKEGFPGAMDTRTKLASLLLRHGFAEVDDLENADLAETGCENVLSKNEVMWVEGLVKRINHTRQPNASLSISDVTQHRGTESAKKVIGFLQAIDKHRLTVMDCGPRKAISEIARGSHTKHDRDLWLCLSKLEAICGGCQHSTIESTISGVRCWAAFANEIIGVPEGKELPPSTAGLVAWSRVFRCKNTFQKYVGKVRVACLLAEVSMESFDRSILERCGETIARVQAPPKQKTFIRHALLSELVSDATKHGDWESASLYVVTYAFMLRMPSEALPMRFKEGSSAVSIDNTTIHLSLARRKNLRHGSTMSRNCWCRKSSQTCPVHVLMKYCEKVAVGQPLFPSHKAEQVRTNLRGRLSRLNIPDAYAYGTHDFRRGHTMDMVMAGAPLSQILKAGQWKSSAFLEYIEKQEVECGAVLEAHMALSDDDSA